MITDDTVISFLSLYELEKAVFEPITSGISSFALMITLKDTKYVLKLYNENSNIETETKFGHYLYGKKIPTARIIRNLKGQLITTISNLHGVLFKFCTGEQINWGDISLNFSVRLAEIMANMHSLMLNNTKISAKNYCKCKIDSVAGLSNVKIIQKSKEVENSINGLSLFGLRRGLIHSDLTRQNVLVTKNRNDVDAIIDFGDAHYDYFVWDLATLITHIFITKTYGIDWVALSGFVKKYYTLFPLNEYEIEVIIPFMRIRNLNLAIEVNRLASDNSKNIDELVSIENSVMTKLDLIDKDHYRLLKLLKGNFD